MHATPLNIFHGMRDRCYNPKSKHYKYYGAKGITIFANWLKYPTVFVAWAEKNYWFRGCHIHRIDNTKGYYPGNCLFISANCHRKLHSISPDRKAGREGEDKMEKRDVIEEVTKVQCRTCGEWFPESEMIDTDYRTYAQQGDPDEMVCEGCYDNYYAKCTECGAVRELVDLQNGKCRQEYILCGSCISHE